MKRLVRPVSFLFLPVLLAACDGSNRAAEEAQEAWSDMGIHSYSYVYDHSCYCPQLFPVRITVENDQIVQVTDPSDGQPIAPGPYPWPTIDDLFQLVLDAQAGGADTLDITYDPSYSFPAKGDIDYDVNATDDELHFTATDFDPE